jgi:hypothetical protein
MARRLLTWALVTPLAAAGILAAHAVAYRLTGASAGAAHAYLQHAPQVVAVLASLGLVGLAVQERSRRPPAWGFTLLAPIGFACQEHVERLAHTGDVPWLLTTPPFLLGLLLQVPVAVLCAWVARRVAGTLTVRSVRAASGAVARLPLTARPVTLARAVEPARRSGRGPPHLLVS